MMAEKMHYARKQRLMHRDTKPGNILLNKNGKAFVADFRRAPRERQAEMEPRDFAPSGSGATDIDNLGKSEGWHCVT